MKKAFLTLLTLILVNVSFGQIAFKTGDSSFDAELNVTNKEAKSDLTTFKRNLTSAYSITTSKIDDLLKIMEPAEIVLTVKIGDIAKKPIDEVVKSYKVNKDKGWGAIAKDMGIKPGSPEFHALKGKSKKANSSSLKGNSGNGNSKGKGNSNGKK